MATRSHTYTYRQHHPKLVPKYKEKLTTYQDHTENRLFAYMHTGYEKCIPKKKKFIVNSAGDFVWNEQFCTCVIERFPLNGA